VTPGARLSRQAFQQDELLPAIEVALARFNEMQALEAENAALADDSAISRSSW